MKHRNWFWGTFFLAAAVFVIASQIGAFVQIGFWSIAATVLLAAVFISSVFSVNFFGILISASLLYLIYQEPLHLIAIPFWQLILTAVLASLGLSLLFHSNRRWKKWESRNRHNRFSKSEESIDGNDIYVRTSFNESCKYLHSDSLEKANLISSFGELSVYFDQVQISPNGAEAFVDVSFGEMKLYLPKNWRVIDHVQARFGAVNHEDRRISPEENAPVLTIDGKVSFGNLEINYV